MKIIVPPFAVAEDDGFKADLFGRKEFGQSLLNLIVNSDDSLVISLDGKWGEGKSTFIKQWRGLAKSEQAASVYIDVFENDYVDDAFISIASAINAFIKKECSNQAVQNAFQNGAVKIGRQLLIMGSKVAIKAATLGFVESTDIEALIDNKTEVADAASDKISGLIKEQLNSHEANNQSIDAFKKLLEELPSKIKNNSSKKLVIVLDELDRCRPSFAVEILERVKHLFSVPNVYFLLVMNKSQLEAAVKCVYGGDIDAQTYLQKFINVEVTLPKRKLKRDSDLNKYGSILLEAHGLDKNKFDDTKYYVDLLAEYYDLSLRELEKTFTNLVILNTTFGNSNSLEGAPLIAALCVLKAHKPVVFEKLSKGAMNAGDFTKEADLQRVVRDDTLEEVLNFFQAFLLNETAIRDLPDTDNVKRIALHSSSLRNRGLARDKIIPFYCEKLSIFKIN